MIKTPPFERGRNHRNDRPELVERLWGMINNKFWYDSKLRLVAHTDVVLLSVVDPNTLNLDPAPNSGFWLNLGPDPGPDLDPGLNLKF